MRASLEGRQELTVRVQQALALATKKEAETVVDAVVTALEATLLNNLGSNGFTLKLGGFGKFSVRHKPGIQRKIPFTGETLLTKDRRKVTFISLGSLRQHERVLLKIQMPSMSSCCPTASSRENRVHSRFGRLQICPPISSNSRWNRA